MEGEGRAGFAAEGAYGGAPLEGEGRVGFAAEGAYGGAPLEGEGRYTERRGSHKNATHLQPLGWLLSSLLRRLEGAARWRVWMTRILYMAPLSAVCAGAGAAERVREKNEAEWCA